MDHFSYRDGRLHAEAVDLDALAAAVGTPCYVYSRATLERHWRVFDAALGDHPHLICYAVKANSGLAVLQVLAQLGSGFDIVSVGELERVLQAGGDPARIVFSGVGKRTDEMRRALAAGIRCFNVESESELQRLNEVPLPSASGPRATKWPRRWVEPHRYRCASIPMSMLVPIPISPPGCGRTSSASMWERP